jgi:glycine cleavage system aminomethyltransferase T
MSEAEHSHHSATVPLETALLASARRIEIGAATVVWDFGDAAAEYTAVRHNAARFDLAAAGVLEVTGPGAFDLLQVALARDVEFVTPEQCLMSLVLGSGGEVVDLITVYLNDGGFWLETSFGRCAVTAAHLASLQAAGHGTAAVVHRADLGGVLIEGPTAASLVEACIDPELGSIPFLGVLPLSWRGRPVTAARSGFTGEFGYKMFAAPADVADIWAALEDARPAGFDALESAMLEVRQPLLHRETASGISALQAGYNWLIDITKDDFHGREAVLKEF